MSDSITIVQSTEAETPDLWRLALLDDRRPPKGPALLAYVGGELTAAVGLRDGQAVADPFRPTADIVDLLRLQARKEVAA
jgi:hypothetical protein